MMEMLAMGKYTAFVWSSFSLTLVVIIVLVVQARSRQRKVFESIESRLKSAQSGQ